jgi:hypothetical protein
MLCGASFSVKYVGRPLNRILVHHYVRICGWTKNFILVAIFGNCSWRLHAVCNAFQCINLFVADPYKRSDWHGRRMKSDNGQP